ncbi:hypothetical protein [Vampirovibrio chlorellavorus]|uniref:hypothetical protein n=1 Tax=Vampirovibrio chlorellavorus TaxID=758823 RepID=UPI0026E9E43A|nr:hypothetical protein [Vampirovibrio chlorellavorus]
MTQISRLKQAEIANGNLINADDLDSEFNQLVTESNSQDTRLTSLETGNITLSGTKSFSAAIKADTLEERSAGAGVTVESVTLKSGSVRLAQIPGFVGAANGEIGYDSTSHVYRLRVNGASRYLVHEGNPVLYKHGITGAAPLYESSSAIRLKNGLRARNSTNQTDIELAADVVLSLDSSGLNGLDTGTKAANTWYYVYLVKRNIDGTTGAVFSTANEVSGGSITLPTGYDLKRQLPLAVRTDGSSNIIPFYITTGWPYRPAIKYRVTILPLNLTPATGQTIVLDAGTASTYTDVSLASFVPPISTQAILRGGVYLISTSGKFGYIRKKGSSVDEFVVQNLSGRTFTEYESEIVETDANQIIQYRMTDATSGMDINVAGYIVTEVI